MNPGTTIAELLELSVQPVAIQFATAPPPGIERIDRPAAAGCAYWKLAALGRTFYTEASDHHGCPIGCHTHGVELPPDTARELESMLETMVGLEYLRSEEIPQISRRSAPFAVAIYAPLDTEGIEPDVVLIRGDARQMMLLVEAAHAAGLVTDGSTAGRPTCAAIPGAMHSGGLATNFGCIGNRVYTDLADGELYFAIAARRLQQIVEQLATIVRANRELERFHRARKASATPRERHGRAIDA